MRIVGACATGDISPVWIGFCMNPSLGFRPFDEFCEHLPKFYEMCEKEDIPILAHCAPGGITAFDAKHYNVLDNAEIEERIEESKERHKMMGLPNEQGAVCSNMYQGKESVVSDNNFDYFYRNYGHPRNWIPVLKYFPDLRLCLAGFGGNSEWQQNDWSGDDTPMPTREWLRCIIKLTKYKNVYTDISGLNIYDENIRSGLQEMLSFAQDGVHNEFAHLRYKLIFGSDMSFTYLTDTSIGADGTRHNYCNYCNEFKKFFYKIDRTGKLWERVSLINPWNFYVLDSKVAGMYDELVKNISGNVNIDMLRKMKSVFDGSDEAVGLAQYISRRNEADPIVQLGIPNENDTDLNAVEVQVEEEECDDQTINSFGLLLAKFTVDNDSKYYRAPFTNSNERLKPSRNVNPITGRIIYATGYDCSGWVGYCINETYKQVNDNGLDELVKNDPKTFKEFYDNVVFGNTETMIKYAENRQNGKYRVRGEKNDGKKLNPKVGDLAFWKGHVEIVIEVNGEEFRTSGSSGNNEALVPKQKRSLTGFFSGPWDDRLKSWGRDAPANGVFLGFWTPALPKSN